MRPVDRSPAENTLFRAYGARYGAAGGENAPVLIPQVYLHYDPVYAFASSLPRPASPLPRQRMDFLLLLPDRRRVVIEVDGKQHYADGDIAIPSGTPRWLPRTAS